MIKFKILCLIFLCIVATKVMSIEKYSNSTVDSQSFNADYRSGDLKQDKPKSQSLPSNKPIKKNEKIKLNQENFQVLKAGGSENIQLQKNSMQNSFQSVYGQAFVINDNPTTTPKSTSIAARKPVFKTLKPIPKQMPAIIPVKPPIKQQPPIYHFNKRPIVYQCCRYVFPADLYLDHMMFYSKYGHSYNLNPSPPNKNTKTNSNKNSGIDLSSNFNFDFNINKQFKANQKQLPDQQRESDVKEHTNENEKLTDNSATNQRSGHEHEEDQIDSNVDGKSADNSNRNLKSNTSIEKLKNESNDKPDEKSSDKSEDIKEPDEAATYMFKTWKMNNKNLYNFGSCTPIYDLGHQNSPKLYPQQPQPGRWTGFFG